MQCPQIGRHGIKNKAAIDLQCELNVKLIAAVLFILSRCLFNSMGIPLVYPTTECMFSQWVHFQWECPFTCTVNEDNDGYSKTCGGLGNHIPGKCTYLEGI